MPTPEQLKIARAKALLSPNIGKRGKGVKTIEKEKRQEIFDEYVSQEFLDLIAQARAEYKLDRFMGPLATKIEHSGLIQTEDLTSEVLAEVKERKKQKLANAKS
jgi:hypothetical protein